MDEQLFDKIADAELHDLENQLSDAEDLELELSMGVLTLTLPDENKIVINSHRAARQIWMAAFRQAWHFSPQEENGKYAWRTSKDELRSTVSRILSEKLGRAIHV